MKIIELFEAPISDIAYHGAFDNTNDTPDRSTSSYQGVDKKLVKNDKYKAKLIRAFSKTPFDFEIAFVDIPKQTSFDAADSDFAGHLVKKKESIIPIWIFMALKFSPTPTLLSLR